MQMWSAGSGLFVYVGDAGCLGSDLVIFHLRQLLVRLKCSHLGPGDIINIHNDITGDTKLSDSFNALFIWLLNVLEAVWLG